MADTFQIEIATPERLLFEEQAKRAQIPALAGYLGVLPDHAPLLSELGAGVLTFVSANDELRVLAIEGGFLEIIDNTVRVLADAAQLGPDIDLGRAEEQLKEATAAVGQVPQEERDVASALRAERGAQARVDAAHKSAQNKE